MSTFVTAIMVTGKTTERYPMAMRAITAFERQVYPNRRLLIINDNEQPLARGLNNPLVTEINVPQQTSLGVLRNLGIQQAVMTYDDADPHYLMQWDDDDYSHPERIEYQVSNTPPGAATIFRWEMHAHLHEGVCFANCGSESRVRGFAGTMMWPAESLVRFQPIGKHEDTEFLLEMKEERDLVVLHNSPALYLRFYHGHNTWSEKHVMKRKQGSRDLTPGEQEYFDRLYRDHYKDLSHAKDDHNARSGGK